MRLCLYFDKFTKSFNQKGLEKIVVYQSYRTQNVPEFISGCMESVRNWARANNYAYRFYDDALFDLVPEWFREKVSHKILPMSDLGRLYAARQLLSEGFDAAVWMDADLFVYSPGRFRIDTGQPFLLTKEVWITYSLHLVPSVWVRVCNAAMVYRRENPFLDFYIYSAEQLVKNREHWVERFRGSNDFRYQLFSLKNKLKPLAQDVPVAVIGTMYLTALHKMFPLPLIENIGLFSPALLKDIASGRGTLMRRYMALFSEPLYAANLCGSFYGKSAFGVKADDALYRKVMENLIQSEGEIMNRYRREIHE